MEIPEPIDAWGVATRDVPDRGLKVSHTADENERTLLAGLADVESVERFEFTYMLKADRAQSYRLKGTLSARVVQPCVLTLEPVTSDIEEEIACRFGASAQNSVRREKSPREKARSGDDKPGNQKSGDDKPILDVEDWEPIDNGRLDIGRILAETFVAAIDPFPRKDGATFEWDDPLAAGNGGTGADGASGDGSAQGDATRQNPFAVLAKLKQKDAE